MGHALEVITERVDATPFADTHEHLVEERTRTEWSPTPLLSCPDWGLLFSHYVDSDLVSAGMLMEDRVRLTAPGLEPEERWELVAPWWPLVRHTGYGRTVELTVQQLYGIDRLSAKTARPIAEAFEAAIRPGYYEWVLREVARVETCQVNSLERPFMESALPDLLLQDISIAALSDPGSAAGLGAQVGVDVRDLAGVHASLDAWFGRYARWAVAVKSQAAYGRRLDFERVPADRAAGVYARLLDGDPLSPAEVKLLEDHLFWECVDRATAADLPVKLHTGYYAGQNGMPMDRLATNPGDASALLAAAPDTRFVFMHMGYPHQEAMLALAKHWTNAVIDMCWAWIVSPGAARRFIKDHVTTAPLNKVLTFGGDFIPVECVVGHAAIARDGLSGALAELVDEGWLALDEALEIVEPLMCGTARDLFRTDAKRKRLVTAPWVTAAGS